MSFLVKHSSFYVLFPEYIKKIQRSAEDIPAERYTSGGSQRSANESSFGTRTSRQVRRWRTWILFTYENELPWEISVKIWGHPGHSPEKRLGGNKERQLCKRSKTLMPQNIPVKALQIHVWVKWVCIRRALDLRNILQHLESLDLWNSLSCYPQAFSGRPKLQKSIFFC